MRFMALILCAAACGGCMKIEEPQSDSGIRKASVRVTTGADGLTAEQRNVGERLVEDNKPGAIKHLYVISAYSGQVLLYSTVRGKVTSSGKRLNPTTATTYCNGTTYYSPPKAAGFYTNEMIQDDGTYGSSVEYVFWWDSKGVYHQHYVAGGQILHVASAPIAVKSVVLNLETTAADGDK